VWDSGPFWPAFSDSIRGRRGARGPAFSQKKQLRSCEPPPSLSLRVFSWVTVSPGESRAGRVGEFPQLGRCPYLILWAGVTRSFMRQIGGAAGESDSRCSFSRNGRYFPCVVLPVGIVISRLVSGFPRCPSLDYPYFLRSHVSPRPPGCCAPETNMSDPSSSPGRTSPRRTSTDKSPAATGVGIPAVPGLAPPPPPPGDRLGAGGPSRVTVAIKSEPRGPATTGTGTAKGNEEWTPTPPVPMDRDATDALSGLASSPAVLSFLASLQDELRADVAGAVETLATGRTPGRLTPPAGRMGSSGSRVLTGGSGGGGGGPGGSSSGDSRRDRRSRRIRRSHRRRRPRPSSSDTSSISDDETVRRVLVDFQIPVRKVGDNLLNTVTDWNSYRLDNQSQTFSSRMRLRITQDRKKLRVSMDRVRFVGTKPAELFSFLRRFVRACNDSNVWEGKALYLLGSFLTGTAATR